MICETDGEIIKVKRLLWIRISSNFITLRKNYFDKSKFPTILKVKYNVNNKEYIGKKFLLCKNNEMTANENVVISYNEDKPQKILALRNK